MAAYPLSVSFLLALLLGARCMQVQPHLCAADDHHPPRIRCRESERQALLGFRHGVGDPSNRLSSWSGQDCCRWAGIGCDNFTGHVVRLDLHNNPLQMNYNSLGGEICPSLLGLQHLTHLDLSGNFMNWNGIPKFMGSFKSLRYLDLSNSGFRGLVPHELGNISNLNHLDLSCDYMDICLLEVDDAGWLSRLTSLRHLGMDGANLSKASNWLQALNTLPSNSLREISLSRCQLQHFSLHPFNFTSLTLLDLSYNAGLFGDTTELREALPRRVRNSLEYLNLGGTGLTGRIPSDWLADFKNLIHLYLAGNSLYGQIPATLGTLSSMVDLDIRYNSLEGVLSEVHFASLTKLEALSISHNPSLGLNVSPAWVPPFQLRIILMDSCKLGPRFPAWLRWQESCASISMSNCGISDSMPGWFWNFSAQIIYMDLSYNEISGELPLLGSDDSLVVDLSHNLLSGPIPRSIGANMPNLLYLFLSHNNLNGSIPSSLCKMKYLAALDLSNNRLLGDVPNCWGHATNLIALDFSSNNLSGEIPNSICSGQLLQLLDLHNNSLVGQIHPSLRNCELIVTLDVSWNKLSGNIPTWMGESLLSLKILQLRSNMFTGNIPSHLSNLAALQILDLSHNNLSGQIPKSFGNFSAMKVKPQFGSIVLNESFYSEHMLLALKGRERDYDDKLLSLTVSIDLSENYLVGTIPEDLGNLIALEILNLSGNHLIGNILERIGRLKQLESLDLSRNELCGAIPSSLSALNFLNHLNLSYNNLSGKIPSGNQLQTLDEPSIYIGNHGLCGFPLPKCQSAKTIQVPTPKEEDDEERSENLWFYIGIETGFVFGFWSLWGIFLLKKPWRVAYFRFIDDLYESMYVTIVVTAARLKIKLLGINPDSV